jgi:hypothetical protein
MDFLGVLVVSGGENGGASWHFWDLGVWPPPLCGEDKK